jgi:hypothetical protein
MQGSGDVIDYLFYPTLVGHIHLNKQLIINSFFIKVIIGMVYSFNKHLINVVFYDCYFM